MRTVINYQSHMLGSMKPTRQVLQLDDGGVNGQIMPDGSELGIPVDFYKPVFQPPQYLLAGSTLPVKGSPGDSSTIPSGRTTTLVPVNPVTGGNTFDAYNPPALTTGPPYVVQDYNDPGVQNQYLIPAGQGGQTSVGAPANLSPSPDPLASAIQGTPIATVTNPPVSTTPATGVLPLMNLDPMTAAINGVSTITPAATPSTTIPLVTPTVAATTPGTITIFGVTIPTWLLWVVGIGGVLLLIFGGSGKRR